MIQDRDLHVFRLLNVFYMSFSVMFTYIVQCIGLFIKDGVSYFDFRIYIFDKML